MPEIPELHTFETHVGSVNGRVLLTVSWWGAAGPLLVVPYTPDAAAAVARELLWAAREASRAPHLGPEPP